MLLPKQAVSVNQIIVHQSANASSLGGDSLQVAINSTDDRFVYAVILRIKLIQFVIACGEKVWQGVRTHKSRRDIAVVQIIYGSGARNKYNFGIRP